MKTKDFTSKVNELRDEYITLCGREVTNEEYKRKIQLNGFLRTLMTDFGIGENDAKNTTVSED